MGNIYNHNIPGTMRLLRPLVHLHHPNSLFEHYNFYQLAVMLPIGLLRVSLWVGLDYDEVREI